MKKIIYSKLLKSVLLMALVCIICAIVLSGCVNKGQNNTQTGPELNATPGNMSSAGNSTSGQGTDGEGYIYGTAAVDKIDVLTLESFPVQVQVTAEGYLPDSCTTINEIKTEKIDNIFNINISTKRPKDAICAQALVPFNEKIPLNVQGLKAGNYTVNVNGVKGSFELTVDNMLNNQPNSLPPRQQVITEADNGKVIGLKTGENFYLRLKENPTTGYSWELNLSQGLSKVSDNYYPPDSSNSGQPLVGAGGVHVWEIKAATGGSQQVNGIYKRPWENITGTEDKFTLNVEVV